MTRLIDEEEAFKVLSAYYKHSTPVQDSALHDALSRVPTAVPVRYGKWITEECLPGVAVCSICGHEIRGIGCQYTNYCDECGARMDEE